MCGHYYLLRSFTFAIRRSYTTTTACSLLSMRSGRLVFFFSFIRTAHDTRALSTSTSAGSIHFVNDNILHVSQWVIIQRWIRQRKRIRVKHLRRPYNALKRYVNKSSCHTLTCNTHVTQACTRRCTRYARRDVVARRRFCHTHQTMLSGWKLWPERQQPFWQRRRRPWPWWYSFAEAITMSAVIVYSIARVLPTDLPIYLPRKLQLAKLVAPVPTMYVVKCHSL